MCAADASPASEQDLPILFNEYCTIWGVPAHENIVKILDAIRGKGISYFVIDCGCYKADGVHWGVSMARLHPLLDVLHPRARKRPSRPSAPRVSRPASDSRSRTSARLRLPTTRRSTFCTWTARC